MTDLLVRLSEFEIWYNEQLTTTNLHNFNVDDYINEVAYSVKRQFTDRSGQRSYIGASALSRPDVLLGLMKLGYPYISKPYALSTSSIFHLGDVFEALILNMMNAFGLKVTGEQSEIRIPDSDVYGHIDGLVDELDAVVEVKTMATSYFKSFVKKPDNYRGYLTQLAVYKYCMGKRNAFWVCFDKETSRVKTVVPDEELLQQYWESSLLRAQSIRSFKTIEDVVLLDPPDPIPEVYKKQETGRLMLPTSMRYTPYYEAFYNTSIGTDNYRHSKVYVDGLVTSPEKRIERINNVKKQMEKLYGHTV